MSYYLTYHGKTITFSSWPLIDTAILGNQVTFESASGLSYKFKAITNWSHYYSGYRIYLNHKIVETDKVKIEGFILSAWISSNHGR